MRSLQLLLLVLPYIWATAAYPSALDALKRPEPGIEPRRSRRIAKRGLLDGFWNRFFRRKKTTVNSGVTWNEFMRQHPTSFHDELWDRMDKCLEGRISLSTRAWQSFNSHEMSQETLAQCREFAEESCRVQLGWTKEQLAELKRLRARSGEGHDSVRQRKHGGHDDGDSGNSFSFSGLEEVPGTVSKSAWRYLEPSIPGKPARPNGLPQSPALAQPVVL